MGRDGPTMTPNPQRLLDNHSTTRWEAVVLLLEVELNHIQDHKLDIRLLVAHHLDLVVLVLVLRNKEEQVEPKEELNHKCHILKLN